jgi:hypothetical protein
MENKELDIFDASFGEKMKHLQLKKTQMKTI